jgi:hypothetical protein
MRIFRNPNMLCWRNRYNDSGAPAKVMYLKHNGHEGRKEKK